MKLYIRPGACSLAAHIVLREAGVPFELLEVDFATKRLSDGSDYLAVNAKGQVPALELDDGTLLTEGPVIHQYLADSYAPELLPACGDIGRYRVLEWLNFVSTELHKTVSPLMRPNTPAEYRTVALEQFQAKLKVVERHLAGRETLTDAGFTIADAYLFVILSWLPMLGLDRAAYPELARYFAALAGRESIRAALEAERLAA